MIEFARKHGHEDGSEERYQRRSEPFRKEQKTLVHHFWWFVHNCVAHPLIGILPIKLSFKFHDWTARKMSIRGIREFHE